jgi:serine/alanine adding enzyme
VGADIRIREATDADASAWNDFLDGQASSSPLARFEWREILRRSYGTRTHFFLAEAAGEVVAVLPTYVARSLRGRERLYSLRFGLVAGDTGGCGTALLDHVVAFAKAQGMADYLITSGWSAVPDRVPDDTRKTLAIDLADEAVMWGHLRDKTRNMVRKAEKNGIEIAEGSQYVDALYDQYAANMLRIGVPFHSRKFFRHTLELFGGHTSVMAALYQGRPVATMLLHFGNGIACYPYQNALYEFRNMAPIQALNWAAMKMCAERGYRFLDMGESGEGSPVYKSKTNFGGRPHDVFYFGSGIAAAKYASTSSGAPGRGPGVLARLENALNRNAPEPVRRLSLQWRLRRGRIV